MKKLRKHDKRSIICIIVRIIVLLVVGYLIGFGLRSFGTINLLSNDMKVFRYFSLPRGGWTYRIQVIGEREKELLDLSDTSDGLVDINGNDYYISDMSMAMIEELYQEGILLDEKSKFTKQADIIVVGKVGATRIVEDGIVVDYFGEGKALEEIVD